jgi:HSP20 family protein
MSAVSAPAGLLAVIEKQRRTVMARLPTPFDTLLSLQQALDSYRTSPWLDAGLSGGGAYRPINVFRKGDDFTLVAEIPGVNKADVDIQVKGRTVRISGSKSLHQLEGASLHRRERSAGQFDRAVSLPFEIDAERVQAQCVNGVLVLHLSRAEQDKPRSITIQ